MHRLPVTKVNGNDEAALLVWKLTIEHHYEQFLEMITSIQIREHIMVLCVTVSTFSAKMIDMLPN